MDGGADSPAVGHKESDTTVPSHGNWVGAIIIPILQRKQLKYRAGKLLVQNINTAGKWQIWELDSGS